MKKFIQSIGVILGLGLMGLAANAQTPKTKKPGEICYWFNSQGLLGEWEEQLLVSKKKLTYKQAHAYMQKNHGMSDIYDIEVLPEDECDAAVVSYSYEPGYLFYYKEPKTTSKAKTSANAQPVKKTNTTTKK